MKPILVQKYGGASLASLDRFLQTAERIAGERGRGRSVVAVVSAMAGETDRLLDLGRQAGASLKSREMDALLATGEQVSAAVLSSLLCARGVPAVSLLGWQLPIRTDSCHGEASILTVAPQRIHQNLVAGRVVVIAGFQGVNDAGDWTTLGRGGSDLTAVATASALEAECCEFLKDVPGIMTADPQICSEARPISRISYDEMLELSGLGSKVLQARSVQLAKRYLVPLHVLAWMGPGPGTRVTKEDSAMEGVIVSAISCDRSEGKISVLCSSKKPDFTASLFESLASEGIRVDVIVQDQATDGSIQLSFTIDRSDHKAATQIAQRFVAEAGAGTVTWQEKVAKVSAVGLGMRTHSGVAARMFRTLTREGVPVMAVSTSEIKLTCVIEDRYAELAVRALHDEFNLAKEPN